MCVFSACILQSFSTHLHLSSCTFFGSDSFEFKLSGTNSFERQRDNHVIAHKQTHTVRRKQKQLRRLFISRRRRRRRVDHFRLINTVQQHQKHLSIFNVSAMRLELIVCTISLYCHLSLLAACINSKQSSSISSQLNESQELNELHELYELLYEQQRAQQASTAPVREQQHRPDQHVLSNRTRKLSIRSLFENHHQNQQTKLPQQQQQQQQVKQYDLHEQLNAGQADSSEPLARKNGSHSACSSERATLPLPSTGKVNAEGQQQQAESLDQTDQQQQLTSFGFVQARVSDYVKPNFYTLRLKVDPIKRKFTGQLMVTLDIISPSALSPPAAAAAAAAAATEAINSSSGGGSSSLNGSGQQWSSALGGYRYLTLHSGLNLNIKKAFYVITARNNVQIPATKIGRNFEQELLTLDFYPNVISSPGQGFLLLVYTGLVNTTESHGLFAHRRSQNAWGTPSKQHQNQHQPIKPIGPINLTSTAVALNSNANLINEQHLGLATQMEPNFARRLFPCWDEPHLKARFSLIVILPFRGYECLSNMPIKRKSISLSCSGDPLQEIEFHTTPTMSTYLLALVIGKFDHIESVTPNNCKVRAYFYSATPPTAASSSSSSPRLSSSSSSLNDSNTQQQQQQQQVVGLPLPARPLPAAPPIAVNQRRQAAQMALDLAVRAFDYLEGLLGVKYPLSKFDMIAVRDFDSGAMENWGASIFHENYMLCDNSSLNVNIRVNGGTSRPKRLVVPLVVAHEIVHQWFGNLITSRSWTYLWLNEGFAQLLMYDVGDNLLPNENYWHIFIEDNRQSAMREDELITSSRALELSDEQLASGDDQMGIFDQLTYNKGAMLLRMVQFALGPGDFVAGLHHYLLKHSYDSVTSHDLWLALEESSDRLADGQLEQLMTNWLKLEGYPLISVQVSETAAAAAAADQHYKLTLTQERFTLLPFEAAAAPVAAAAAADQAMNQTSSNSNNNRLNDQSWSDWLWPVPLTVSSELQPSPSESELRLWPLKHPSPALQRLSSSSSSSSSSPIAPETGAAAATTCCLRTTSLSQAGNSIMFGEKSATLLVAKSSLGAWFKLNSNAIGYFRVDYKLPSSSSSSSQSSQVDMLARLRAPIRDQSMGLLDRFNIIEDLFAMVLSGRKSLVYYLRFVLDSYDQETELLVLRFIFDSFDRIRQAIVSNSSPSSNSNSDPNQLAVDLSSSSPSSSSSSSSSSSWKRQTGQHDQLESLFNGYVRKYLRKLIAALKMRAAAAAGAAESAADKLPPMSHPAHPAHHHIQLNRLNKQQWKRATTTSTLFSAVSVADNDDNNSNNNSNNNNHNQKRSSDEQLESVAPSSSSSLAAFISLNQQLKQQLKQHQQQKQLQQQQQRTNSKRGAQQQQQRQRQQQQQYNQHRQQQQQQRANENNFAELLELLDSIRLTYNELELSQHGAQLFARHHFRSSTSPARSKDDDGGGGSGGGDDNVDANFPKVSTGNVNGSAAPKSPFELMGRELRASIYASALNYQPPPKQQQQQQQQALPVLQSASSRRSLSLQMLHNQQPAPQLHRPSTQLASSADLSDDLFPQAPAPVPTPVTSSADTGQEESLRLRNVAGNQNFSSAQLLQNYDYDVTSTTAAPPTQPLGSDSVVLNKKDGADDELNSILTTVMGQDQVFSKLLEQYYSSDTTSLLERSAIAQALGAVSNATKQAYLLNLTLSGGGGGGVGGGGGSFRLQDAGLLLDSMAQTKSGRQLIWTQLNDNIKLFKQRQLLSVALKCVSRGLIEQQHYQRHEVRDKNLNNGDIREPLQAAYGSETTVGSSGHDNSNNSRQQQQQSNQRAVERQLRQLYVIYGASEHGQLIGQAIEWVRINTLWFKRDLDELADFLASIN